MARSIDYAKCPQCGKKFEMGFNNYWMSSAFGEYSFNQTNHKCEQCGCDFNMTVKKQIVFNTKMNRKTT
jgi:transcription elongation factor Elf1